MQERIKRGYVIIDLMGNDDEVDQTFEIELNETERNTDRKRVPFEEPALEIVPVDPT